MECPTCGNEVPARPVCLRCGASLFGSPPPTLPASALGPIRVPLTLGQKARLLVRCVPPVTFALLVAGYLALVRNAIVPAPPPLFFLVMGAVILVSGYGAIQSLRDVLSGVALVREDLLNRSYRSRGGTGLGSCYGRFERLGTLRIVPKLYVRRPPGQRYRVVYSPASKIVWALEPPDPRIRS